MEPSVCMIHPNFFVNGGAERQLAILANYLTDHNYRVNIFTIGAIPEFRACVKEARIFEVGNMQQLDAHVKNMSHKFDIINTHNHPAELLPMPIKVRHVWQSNEPQEVALRGGDIDPVEREMVNRCVNRVMVISDYDKERFKRLYGMESIVNYPGCSSEYFSTVPDMPSDIWRVKGKFTITQVGYLTWTKNQLKSVEILSEVKKTIPDARLVLAGFDRDVQYRQKVYNRAIELGVEEDVVITGYLADDSAVRDLYALSDVHIMPVMDQGGWSTIFESLCSGLPNVVSEKFVASNLLKNHSLCDVVPLETDAFVQKILDIAKDSEGVRKRTYVQSQWIRDNLTWDRFCEKYCEVFDDLIKKGK